MLLCIVLCCDVIFIKWCGVVCGGVFQFELVFCVVLYCDMQECDVLCHGVLRCNVV